MTMDARDSEELRAQRWNAEFEQALASAARVVRSLDQTSDTLTCKYTDSQPQA
ncbi:hypothetical protein [Kitasatospora aureofaciens]|uniref:hypothetical protein n=1 Tax=Kitasatospora aureofaciens TaxID=1894 RepID=UPI00131B9CCE|nr:hypothetical protein [Kitasatospora aureofaciens]